MSGWTAPDGKPPPWRYSDGTEIGAVGAVNLSRGGPSVITDSGGEWAAMLWRTSYFSTRVVTTAGLTLFTAALSGLGSAASSLRRGTTSRWCRSRFVLRPEWWRGD